MKKILTIAFAIAMVCITACKKDDNHNDTTPTNTDSQLIKIGETYIIGANAKATVYAAEELFAGYNKLYVKLTDSTDGSELTDGHFSISPNMDMGGMSHAAPVENTHLTAPVNGYYNSNVVFIMPSTQTGVWTLNLHLHNHKNDLEGNGLMTVNVKSKTPERVKSITGSDSSKLFISYILPDKPEVGINDFEIAVHSMLTNVDFPAVTDYTVEIDPEMPSMGHGSPNNVNPVHTADGHYKGKVNFTMTGLWRINVTLKKNGTVISDQLSFDVTF